MMAQALDIGDQVRSRIVFNVALWPASAATALIEQDDAIKGRVEEASLPGVASTAGAAVQKDNGGAMRVATLFVVHRMAIADVQPGVVVGLYLGV